MAETSFIYDLRGLKCPLVLLKTKKKKAKLAASIKLVILSDDPLAPLDIALYCHQNNFKFEEHFENGHHLLSIISSTSA